jgi:hypothetical protein
MAATLANLPRGQKRGERKREKTTTQTKQANKARPKTAQAQMERRRPESNRCKGFCRPLPEPLGHAAAGADCNRGPSIRPIA